MDDDQRFGCKSRYAPEESPSGLVVTNMIMDRPAELQGANDDADRQKEWSVFYGEAGCVGLL